MNKKSTRALASATVVGLVLTTAISTGNVQAAQGKVDRLHGANRYETAAKVATSNWKAGETKNVILVSGEGYADALSASLLAQKLDAPVLLTGKDNLDVNAKNAINKLGAKNVYILGSKGVVSENIKSSLENEGKTVKRLAGKDRYETNIAIANELVSNHGVSAKEVLVVNGNKYLADALTAAPVAAKEGKILLLVGEDEGSANEAKKFIDAHSSKVTVIGRDVTVSDAIYNKLGAKKRVKGGSDRFETNRLVLKEFGLQGSHVYIANGQNNHLVDSLVASALAGKFKSPVVLVSNDKEEDAKAIEYMKDELKINDKTDLNVVGSEAILSDDLVKDIDNAVVPEVSKEELVKKANEAIKAIPAEINKDNLEAARAAVVKAETAVKAAKDAKVDIKELKGLDKIEAANKKIAEIDKAIEEAKKGVKVESVSAINSTQAEVKFNKEVKEVKPANFKVTDKDGNLVFVSKVELNESKNVATLTFFDKFADKATYNVEVKGIEKLVKIANVKFEYKKAEVAKVQFTQTQIAKGENLKNIVKVTDKLGRDVTNEVELKFESSDTTVIDATGKILKEGQSIVVAKVGDVKTASTTVKVKDGVATEFAGYYVYKSAADPVADTDAFLKLKEEDKVNYVYMKDNNTKKVALYYNDQYGKPMNAVKEGLKVTNMTPSVVIVENDGSIKPISVGEGFVKVKANDNLEHTIKVVVKENQAIASMKLEKANVSVIKGKEDTIKVKYKDQYGQEATAENKVLKVEAKDNKIAKVTALDDGKTLKVEGLAKGETTAEVSYKVNDKLTLKETIKIVVEEAADLEKYEVKVDTKKLDLNAGDKKDQNKDAKRKVEVKINQIDENGNNLGNVNIDGDKASLVLVDKDGKELEEAEKIVSIDSNKNIKAEKVGKGYVQVKVGTLVIQTLEFEVVDSKATAKTVEFNRNDLAYKATSGEENALKITLADKEDAHSKIEDDVKSILTFKDQNGKDIKVDGSTISIEVTNESEGLTITSSENSHKITAVTKEKSEADVVIKSIKDGKVDLLEKPTTIKISIDAKEYLEAKGKAVAEKLAVAKEEYIKAKEAAEKAGVDVKKYEIEDVEKANVDDLTKATIAINNAVEEAKKVADKKEEAAKKLEEAKQTFNELKETVTELNDIEANKTFKVKIEEGKEVVFTIVNDKTSAEKVEKDKAFATKNQAKAIKSAMVELTDENANTEDKVKELTETLKDAIDAVKTQVGTKEAETK